LFSTHVRLRPPRSGRACSHPEDSSHESSARILVTGCYAQRAPEEISALDGVSLVVGNSHKHRLAEIAAGNGFVPLGFIANASLADSPASAPGAVLTAHRAPIVVEDIFAHTELLAAPVFDSDNEKTRPILKCRTDATTAALSA